MPVPSPASTGRAAGIERVGDIPQPDRPGFAAGREECALRAECYRVDALPGPGPSNIGVGGIGDIPQPDRPVEAAAGERVPVGGERHRIDLSEAAGQGPAERPGSAGSAISHSRIVPYTAAGQRLPVGDRRHRSNGLSGQERDSGVFSVLSSCEARSWRWPHAVGGQVELGRERRVTVAELGGASATVWS